MKTETMKQTQKQRLEEAYMIHKRFHNWMGFLVCDGEEDILALRKLVKKIEREAIKEFIKELKDRINSPINAESLRGYNVQRLWFFKELDKLAGEKLI